MLSGGLTRDVEAGVGGSLIHGTSPFLPSCPCAPSSVLCVDIFHLLHPCFYAVKKKPKKHPNAAESMLKTFLAFFTIHGLGSSQSSRQKGAPRSYNKERFCGQREQNEAVVLEKE